MNINTKLWHSEFKNTLSRSLQTFEDANIHEISKCDSAHNRFRDTNHMITSIQAENFFDKVQNSCVVKSYIYIKKKTIVKQITTKSGEDMGTWRYRLQVGVYIFVDMMKISMDISKRAECRSTACLGCTVQGL